MADSKKIIEELVVITGPDRVKTDPAETAPYRLDGVVPQAVVFPSNTKMVAEIMKCASHGHLTVVPWGSGTKMGLGNNPKAVDLVVCTSRLNHMLDVDTANLTITVEAGVKFRDIQARLATEEDRCYLPLKDLKTEAGEFVCSDRSHSGSFLPLDPPFSEKATIGGIVAANSSGPRRLLYGLPRDLVLGLRFVTPTGDIVGAGGKTVKNVSGYDISKLMIGSLGSLGILCEITLRLLPLPENMETLVFTFDSWSAASGFATALLATKLLPAAVEVCNGAALERMDFRSDLQLLAGPFAVLIALEAFQEAVIRMRQELVVMAEHFKAQGQTHITEAGHHLFWLAVGEIRNTLSRDFPGLVSLQLNYPLSSWKGLFEFADKTLREEGVDHTILCHSGSGVSLINLLLDQRTADRDRAIKAVGTLLAECRQAGGNLVVQSAPAGWKASLPVWGEAGSDLPLMKRIREQLDPAGLLNPGRFAVGV